MGFNAINPLRLYGKQIMTNNHKTHLRMETEVLRLYQSGVEMQGLEHYGCMTTKNAHGDV